jgi:glycosyltransferase involved in cell wall biosynthesis
MKVLYFHQHFTTPKGVGGTRPYELAQALLREGHEVTLVCGSYKLCDTGLSQPFVNSARRGTVDGIDVLEFDVPYSNHIGIVKRSWLFLQFSFRAMRVALREEFDLAFASSTPLTSALPGMAAKILRRKPFVFEVRDLWPELPRAMGVVRNPVILGLLGLLEWAAYRSADRCVALAPGILEGIKKRGIPGSNIQLVPNGCDLNFFKNEHTVAWRPDGIPEHALLAVYSGTHGTANGLEALLRGGEVLAQRGRTDIYIALVGEGREKAWLKSEAARLGLKNVVFLPGVDKERLTGLLAASDIGLQVLRNVPAFYEGTSPNKFFDYLSASLPVLCNYPGWIARLITDNNCGFALQPDSALAFADALEQAADDRNVLFAKGQNARALGEREFDRALLARRWVAWVTRGERL